MISIRKSVAAATIATLMSAGTALAAQPSVTGPSGVTGQQQVAMNTAGAPTQFTGISATCAPNTGMTTRHAAAHRNASPPTFTPWLNINNGQ